VEQLQLAEVAATDRTMLDEIGALRVRSWRAVRAFAGDVHTWLDSWDQHARHWAFLKAGRPVAAARLSVHQSLEHVPDAEVYAGVFREPLATPLGSFNRLVVDPGYRGLGLSRALDTVRMAAAQAMGCHGVIVATTPGSRRTRQLQALGFVVIGAGRPHDREVVLRHLETLVLFCHLSLPGQ
jgi:GNAT superfamily N-acetyltransferase